MPSIAIREKDLTTSASAVIAEDVVFVPGFINAEYVDDASYVEAYVPTLCETVDEFETSFGEYAPVFTKDYTYADIDFDINAVPKGVTSNIFIGTGDMDYGYVYAKELLMAGIPVYYVRCNRSAEEIDVEHMYDVLNGSATDDEGNSVNIWDEIKDPSEYQEIKYLTSGGYPVFEYTGDMNIKYTDPSGVIASFDEDVFKTVIGYSALKSTTTCRFIYAYEKTIAKVYETKAAMDAAVNLESVSLDDRFWVNLGDDAGLYKLNIATSGTRSLVKVSESDWKVWTLIISNDEGSSVNKGVQLETYGITQAEGVTSYEAGTIFIIKVPITKSSVVVAKMLNCASSRQDCIAIIDHTDNPYRTLNPLKSTSLYYSVSDTTNSPYSIKSEGEFAAMFTPWCGYACISTLQPSTSEANVPTTMPASMVYFRALADSIKTNANWLAIAGAARGVANITKPNLAGTLKLTNSVADSYQPDTGISINPITNVKPYGYLIWGNRTLKNNIIGLAATSFLSTRNMISDIKKIAYIASRKCMFEQNSDILWINFTGYITPVLDNMVSGNGLSGYKLIQETPDKKAQLKCTIRIYPIYAVESFDITVEIADEEVSVS